MHLPPFLLDDWIAQKQTADPPIEFDLASSTGPVWTLRELMALSDGAEMEQLLDARLFYTSSAGSPELREAIGNLEGVPASHVQVVTGAAEALLILMYQAAESGANVVLPSPAFPANDALCEGMGIEIRHYLLRAENEFRVDPDEIRNLVDRNTKLLLVNSPHNPSGAVLSDREMESLHDFCAERGILFVSDQVYHPIYHGPETRTAAHLPHATVISDFSKALCLSGLRVGWIVEPNPERRARYRNARNYFTITNNSIGERLAVLALRQKDAIYARARRVATANLALLDQMMSDAKDIVQWVRPAGGMTAFPWLTEGGDTRGFCRRLAKHGVLIVPGDCFGRPSHFRVGFATSGEQFAAGLERFAEFLRAASREGSAASG